MAAFRFYSHQQHKWEPQKKARSQLRHALLASRTSAPHPPFSHYRHFCLSGSGILSRISRYSSTRSYLVPPLSRNLFLGYVISDCDRATQQQHFRLATPTKAKNQYECSSTVLSDKRRSRQSAYYYIISAAVVTAAGRSLERLGELRSSLFITAPVQG
jgi:hypothetical protein